MAKWENRETKILCKKRRNPGRSAHHFVFDKWILRTYAYKGGAKQATIKSSPRVQVLFEKTKLLCFGRYAIEVPQEAQLTFGSGVFRQGIYAIAHRRWPFASELNVLERARMALIQLSADTP
jgi:hypothetical protein